MAGRGWASLDGLKQAVPLLCGGLPILGRLLEHARQLHETGLVGHAVTGPDLVPEVPAGIHLPHQVACQGTSQPGYLQLNDLGELVAQSGTVRL